MSYNLERGTLKKVLLAHIDLDEDEALKQSIEGCVIDIDKVDDRVEVTLTSKSTSQSSTIDKYTENLQEIISSAFGIETGLALKVLSSNDRKIEHKAPQTSTHVPFEDLIFGKCNMVLKQAVNTILKDSLFSEKVLIVGPKASGKTTILKSLCHELRTTKGVNAKIQTAQKFTREFVECVRSKNWSNWENQFSDLDILIIEDLSAIKTRVKTLDNLYQIVSEFIADTGDSSDAVQKKTKHLIITSQEPIQNLQLTNPDLVGFLESMSTVRIAPPSDDVINKLTKKFFEKNEIELDNKSKKILIEHFKNKPHTMQGIMKSVLMEYQALVEDHFEQSSLIAEENHQLNTKNLLYAAACSVIENTKWDVVLTEEKIIHCICNFYKLELAKLKKPGRTEPLLEARQMASYLMKHELGWSFPQIGKFFNQSHTTAINGVRKLESFLKSEIESAYQKHYNDIMKLMK